MADLEKVIENCNNASCEFEFSSFNFKFSSLNKIENKKATFIDRLEKSLGKKFAYDNAELTFLINNNNTVLCSSKNIVIEGSYKKFSRTLPQVCENLSLSVEDMISKSLKTSFDSKDTVVSFLSSENKNALVLGEGIHFKAEIVSPYLRTVNLSEIEDKINKDFENQISIKLGKNSSGSGVVTYSALIESDTEIDQDKLELLNKISNLEVLQQSFGKLSERKIERRRIIRRIRVVKVVNSKLVVIEIKADKGFSFEKFLVSSQPNLNTILDNICKCKELDIIS